MSYLGFEKDRVDLYLVLARAAAARGIELSADPVEKDWGEVTVVDYASEFGREADIMCLPTVGYRTFLRLERRGIQTHVLYEGKPSSLPYLIDYAKQALPFPSHLFGPIEVAIRVFNSLEPGAKAVWEAEIERYGRLTNDEMMLPENWYVSKKMPFQLRLLREDEWMKRKLDSLK
jgi:hypothetical protein